MWLIAYLWGLEAALGNITAVTRRDENPTMNSFINDSPTVPQPARLSRHGVASPPPTTETKETATGPSSKVYASHPRSLLRV